MTNFINYSVHLQKREIQTQIFSKDANTKIVTLLGPSLKNYVKFLKNLGYNEIISFEKDRTTFLYQLSQVKRNHKISLIFGDILEEETLIKDATYDIDLCCSALSLGDIGAKLKDVKFVVTLSTRPLKEEKTISIFEDCTNLKKDRDFIMYKYNDRVAMTVLTNIL